MVPGTVPLLTGHKKTASRRLWTYANGVRCCALLQMTRLFGWRLPVWSPDGGYLLLFKHRGGSINILAGYHRSRKAADIQANPRPYEGVCPPAANT